MPQNEAGWFGLRKAVALLFRVPGNSDPASALPVRGIDMETTVHFAPKGGAVPGERIVGIRGPEGITIYPIHSPALAEYNDEPDRWLDVRWDLENVDKALYSTQIVITMLNEPGALGAIATTIGEYGANIDAISSSASGADFRDLRIDLQVRDIQHLNAMPRSCGARAWSARSKGSAADMPLYFAYGSNMSVEAMARRCPRSKALGLARLERHRLAVMREGWLTADARPALGRPRRAVGSGAQRRGGARPLRGPVAGPLRQGRASGRHPGRGEAGARLLRRQRRAGNGAADFVADIIVAARPGRCRRRRSRRWRRCGSRQSAVRGASRPWAVGGRRCGALRPLDSRQSGVSALSDCRLPIADCPSIRRRFRRRRAGRAAEAPPTRSGRSEPDA